MSGISFQLRGTTVRYDHMILVFVFIILVVIIVIKKKLIIKNHKIIVSLILCILVILFSSTISVTSDYSLNKSILYIIYAVIIIILLFVQDKKQEIVNFFIGFGVLINIISLISFPLYFLGFDFGTVRYDFGSYWLEGFNAVANINGISNAILFLYILNKYLNTKKSFLIIYLLIISTCLIMSYTRISWLGVFFGTIFLLFKNKSFTSGVVTSTILIVSVSFFLFILSSYVTVFDKIDELNVDYLTSNWRYYIILIAFSNMQNWWLGNGTENLIAIHGFDNWYYIANLPISILYDWGILGVSSFLVFFIYITKKLDNFGIMILLIYLLMNITSPTIQLMQFWYLPVLLLNSHQKSKI